MADAEPTTPQEGNGQATNEADTQAALAAARELLISQGHQVLDSSAFHGIKTEARAKAEAEKAELAAKLESLQEEHAKLAEWKTKLDNQGKSEAELHREQFKAWQEADKAKDAQLAEAQKQAEALQKSLESERVQNRIRALMPNATNSDAAQMWAERHIGQFLSTDENGQLVWTESTGIPHIGVAAEKLVSEWWAQDSQKFLHAGNVPGPVTSGAPSAPTPKTESSYVRNPALSQMENYVAAEEWDKKHGLK